MDILKDGKEACAFLITGVVTGSGVVFESTDVKDGADEVGLGVNMHGAPLGFAGKRSKKRTLKVDWEDPGPAVLAFCVQKLQIKGADLTATEDTNGAYFGDGDEPHEYEVEFGAKLSQRNIAGLELETGQDQLTGVKFRLYLPDE